MTSIRGNFNVPRPSDLVDRLQGAGVPGKFGILPPLSLYREAADEIERLRKALSEIRALANSTGDRRAIIAKIYGIATEVRRSAAASQPNGVKP